MFGQGNMEKMMKQMGMNMEELPAKKVTIEMEDGRSLVFDSPEINKIEAKGQEIFQLQGNYTEADAGPSEDDVELVMDRTGSSKEEARRALEEHGDITDAIMSLE